MEAETGFSIPSYSVPRRARAMPDIHDIQSTVGRADGEVVIKYLQDESALVSAWLRMGSNSHLFRSTRCLRTVI